MTKEKQNRKEEAEDWGVHFPIPMFLFDEKIKGKQGREKKIFVLEKKFVFFFNYPEN